MHLSWLWGCDLGKEHWAPEDEGSPKRLLLKQWGEEPTEGRMEGGEGRSLFP